MAQAITISSKAPFTSFDFDKAYQLPFTFWADFRIPTELKTLIAVENPKSALELGCGLGRFSNYVAKQGVKTVGVDFSRIAIEKARTRIINENKKPDFLIADVTNLHQLNKQFDVSFDVGCFHCLSDEEQYLYAEELNRLLKPGATHLIWAMDDAPNGSKLNRSKITETFKGFKLVKVESSRRRIAASHWYWLVKEGASLRALSLQN